MDRDNENGSILLNQISIDETHFCGVRCVGSILQIRRTSGEGRTEESSQGLMLPGPSGYRTGKLYEN